MLSDAFIENLLNPTVAATMQRLSEGVSKAYASDNAITAPEISSIVAQVAEGGVSDDEMVAARLLLTYERNYLPTLRSRAESSRDAGDAARLREAEAALQAYGCIVQALETLRAP